MSPPLNDAFYEELERQTAEAARKMAEGLTAKAKTRRPVNWGRSGIPTPPPGERPMIDYGQRTGREGLEWYDRRPTTVWLRHRLARLLVDIGERVEDAGYRLWRP